MADNSKMSREEAGRKGGNKTAREHNKDFYEKIGEKGGKESSRQRNNSNS
ncbi:hypothetical protein [Bacillus suaedae]|uniref:Stress-induced protein, KGG, repeat-containing protein n=1 Tax=Halalkalibacter suaedae TaxID=2822140 RepID=A0A940X1E5_9BACI|nr:hypothetical protein [Bacillus suaedae]MBP3953034.1 hypothetical protein [Bacillus suaedae]